MAARTDPYEILAQVYDQPDHEEITRAFLASANRFINERPEGSWVMDLACGTGIMASILSGRGVPVVGVDRSARMLRIARKRCRGSGVRFIQGDLATFRVDRPCAVATLCGDIVNHLPSAAVVRRVFRRIHQQLQPGGVLLFESHRRFCYEEYWKERTYHMEGDGGDLIMECDWDPRLRQATARMIGYVRNGPGRFRKVETTLREYFHSTQTLRAALGQAGFERIRPRQWSPWSDQHLEPEMDRLFWVARKG